MTTEKKTAAKTTLLAPLSESPVVRGGLLLPVADEETLIESFKRYVALKDKLLEESDYVWFAVYSAGQKTERDGFPRREEAEKKITNLRAKGIPSDLEKRVKKSGCLKLGKAFGISTEIISERIDREKGYAEYTVRATAPNGQSKDKTGSSDRAERGKASAPFDTIMATANTRAEDRALMALLGGETTAEEFESGGETPPPTEPSKDSVHVKIEVGAKPVQKVERKPLTPEEEKEIAERAKKAAENSTKPPDLSKLTPEEKERLKALDEKFGRVKPAQPSNLYQLRGRMFAASKDAGLSTEELKKGISNKYRKESTKDLTEQELLELIGILKDMAREKDNPLAPKA